jgi:hypothetical protein
MGSTRWLRQVTPVGQPADFDRLGARGGTNLSISAGTGAVKSSRLVWPQELHSFDTLWWLVDSSVSTGWVASTHPTCRFQWVGLRVNPSISTGGVPAQHVEIDGLWLLEVEFVGFGSTSSQVFHRVSRGYRNLPV